MIWSCATLRPNVEKDEYCEVNLPLLKGYLYEIKNEVYVEDINLKLIRDRTYKQDDINSMNGFSDYKPVDDHPRIQMQVAQVTLIDPYTIMEAFGIENYNDFDDYRSRSAMSRKSRKSRKSMKSLKS